MSKGWMFYNLSDLSRWGFYSEKRESRELYFDTQSLSILRDSGRINSNSNEVEVEYTFLASNKNNKSLGLKDDS